MNIQSRVERLCRKCDTRDPFEITRQLRIIVLYEDLGSIRGYYSGAFRQRFIHINSCLDEIQQKIVCAHELGHAIMHSGSNTPFLRANTLYSVNRLEVEANRFMMLLLYPRSVVNDLALEGRTIEQIALALGVTPALVSYSFETG